MLKRMILTSLLAVAAAPVLASDASPDARVVGPKVSERKEAESAAAKAPHSCQCQHPAPPAVNFPTDDSSHTNS